MNTNSLKKALKNFLSNEIKIYNSLKSTEKFLKFYEIKITKYEFSKEELLRIFYFNRFFSLIFCKELKNKTIDKLPLNENKEFISSIEDFYLNKLFIDLKNSNKNVKNNLEFFNLYGNYRKSLVLKLYNKYLENFNEIQNYNTHLDFLRIFMIQNLDNNWEEHFINIIYSINDKTLLNKTEFFLLFHFSEKLKFKNNITIKYDLNRRPKIDIKDEFLMTTKTQTNIKKYLKILNIEFLEEYTEDGFAYDYYLPKLNIVLEFDGPIHFYPLQIQFLDWNKFRYKMINDLFKRRVVYIPYFEWMKLETENFSLEYLKNIIYNHWDYNNTNCFRESYDYTNIQRKF